MSVSNTLTTNNLNINYSSWYYGYSIIYLNVYIYIYLVYLIFCLLFVFNTKKIKTISALKVFSGNNFLCITATLAFLSIAGIPPLAGFLGKFLIFSHLFCTGKYLYLLVFLFLNFISIYFYIQNLRFLISQTQPNFYLFDGFYASLDKNLINIIVLMNFYNVFGIFLSEDILYLLINISLSKNYY